MCTRMKLRDVTLDECTVTLKVEQDDMPVRGNVMVSGDDEADKRVEDEVLDRLADGDVWAWALVRVRVTWKPGWMGEDILGGCTYENEEEFKKDNYFESMVKTALDQLNASVKHSFEELQKLVVIDRCKHQWKQVGSSGLTDWCSSCGLLRTHEAGRVIFHTPRRIVEDG